MSEHLDFNSKIPDKKVVPSLEEIRNELKSFPFTGEELIQIFNRKYKDGFHGLTLLDESGLPAENFENEKVFVKNFEEIDEFSKKRHMRGFLKQLDTKVDYVKKISEEKEIIDLLKEKGSNLDILIKEYLKEEN